MGLGFLLHGWKVKTMYERFEVIKDIRCQLFRNRLLIAHKFSKLLLLVHVCVKVVIADDFKFLVILINLG